MKQKKDFFIDSLHIFILAAFAFAQPIFDLLSKNTTFFVARQSEPVDVVILVLLLCVVIPVLMVVVEALAGIFDQGVRKIIYYYTVVCLLVIFMSRELEPENVILLILFLCIILPIFLFVLKTAVSFSNKDPRKVIHYFYVAFLIAVTVLPPLKKVQLIPGTVLLVLAVVTGMVFTVCYVRFSAVQLFMTVLAPSLLIFPGLFLFNSPVYKIIAPEKGNVPTSLPVTLENPPPIVMVVFDGFNAISLMNEERAVDPVRYPHFAKLAVESNWFRNATTVSDSTGTAVPAILTGNYPDPDLLPTSADHPDNILSCLAPVIT